MDKKEIVELLVEILRSKKSQDIVLLDVMKVSSITESILITSTDSSIQIKAIQNELKDNLKINHRLKYFRMDGDHESKWIVADYGSVILHVFHYELRELYDLESLWGDADIVKYES